MNDTLAFRRALWFGLAVALAVAVVGAAIGAAVAGLEGVWSALLGAAVAAVFTTLSAGTVLLGVRLTRHDPANPMFYAVILGGWIAKFAIFVAAMVLLRDAPFIQPTVLLICVLTAVVLSVGADVVAVLGTKESYVSGLKEAEKAKQDDAETRAAEAEARAIAAEARAAEAEARAADADERRP
jgi:nucleoid-associated protein YgaU